GANDAKRFLAHPIGWREIVRRIIPDPPDGIGRDKYVDVDGPRAFQRDLIDIVILKEDIIVFTPGIALDLILLSHRLAANAVDGTADHSVAGFGIHREKAHLFCVAGRGSDDHWAIDHRQF